MYVRAGRPAFARPCVGVHKSTSLMSSSLLLQQCPACLVRLNWIVFVIGGRWPYSWCLVRFFDIRREIGTIFLGRLFHQPPPPTPCDTYRKASVSPESQPSSSDAKIQLYCSEAGNQLTDFSQISAHTSSAWRHSHPPGHIFYQGFLF